MLDPDFRKVEDEKEIKEATKEVLVVKPKRGRPRKVH
jgi:hypothetical protein